MMRGMISTARGRVITGVAGLLLVAAAGAAVVRSASVIRHALRTEVQAAEPLSAYVPQGSLLAIESPDFTGVLGAWTSSNEEKAWVKSDNYADFSRSRLFSRLGEAQGEFAASAGLDPDAKFLEQVAGKESIFAWYDIGKLEFLYVTRMKPGDAAANPLVKLESKFQMRKAGADSFYVRAEAAKGDDAGAMQSGEQSQARTVAFAVHGDLLLLATREDLIAGALMLAQHQGDISLHNEPWYSSTVAAMGVGDDAHKAAPELLMTLNLTKIVPSPYFRSYWVQRNVSEMKQYSGAVSALYREDGGFREERVLIPKAQDAEPVAADLSAVMRYVPAGTGVYRAVAMPGADEVVAQLNQRLLTRGAAAYRDMRVAPEADLTEASAGIASDLDTRIDEQPVPVDGESRALAPLKALIEAGHAESMLTYSTVVSKGKTGSSDEVFLPVHSGVVIAASGAWDAGAVESAVGEALKGALTVGGMAMSWKERREGGESWMELAGMQPLAIAARGNVLVVASDGETMLEMLKAGKTETKAGAAKARMVAGFNHGAERAGLERLAALLDNGWGGTGPGDRNTPPFFSRDMGGLSETFSALDSEDFVERATESHVVRQTIVYRLKP